MTARKRTVFIILASGAVLGETACTQMTEPTIHVAAVETVDVTPNGIGLEFIVDVTNANSDPLELLEIEYQLSVQGMRAFVGRHNPLAVVGSGGSRQLQIPAAIPFHALNWNSRDVPERFVYDLTGAVQYREPGEIEKVLFDLGVRKPRTRFSDTGRLSLQDR